MAKEVNAETVRAARTKAAEIAERALRGEISMLLGARELARISDAVGVDRRDPDFLAFYAVHSVTDHLPLDEFGAPRDLKALRDFNQRFGASEAWARGLVLAALKSVSRRFR